MTNTFTALSSAHKGWAHDQFDHACCTTMGQFSDKITSNADKQMGTINDVKGITHIMSTTNCEKGSLLRQTVLPPDPTPLFI